jgi:ankyrin repeat protein
VNTKDAYGTSLLARSTALSLWPDKEVAQTLLELGADPNEELYDGAGLLHHAASYGREEIVEILLENGASVSAKDGNSCTPLDWVLFCALWDEEKYKDTARLLRERGGVSGRPCLSKLFGAVKEGDCGRVRRLLEEGADVNIKGLYGHTLLIEAVKLNNLAMVRMLLDRGAEVNTKAGFTKYTALHIAARYFGRGEAGDEIVRLLIGKGAEVDAANTEGQTPLHSAADAANAKAVKILLARGADVNARDRDGMTALDIAEKWNRKEIIQLLSQPADGASPGSGKSH